MSTIVRDTLIHIPKSGGTALKRFYGWKNICHAGYVKWSKYLDKENGPTLHICFREPVDRAWSWCRYSQLEGGARDQLSVPAGFQNLSNRAVWQLGHDELDRKGGLSLSELYDRVVEKVLGARNVKVLMFPECMEGVPYFNVTANKAEMGEEDREALVKANYWDLKLWDYLCGVYK